MVEYARTHTEGRETRVECAERGPHEPVGGRSPEGSAGAVVTVGFLPAFRADTAPHGGPTRLHADDLLKWRVL